MNSRPYSQILDEVAKDHLPANLNLAPDIIDRIQKGKGLHMQPRLKVVVTLFISVMILTVLFFTVPSVKAAIQRWFGYIPGVGLVQEGQIRTLEKPVSVTRDGVTVTVEQVILNQDRTTLVYSVDGIPGYGEILQPSETFCAYEVSLILPDGSSFLATPNGADSPVADYRHRFDFPSIPNNVHDASLGISCLYQTRPGSAPENWEIPLHFIPAPADMTVFPVIEVSTPISTSQNVNAASDQANGLSADTVTLTIDRAVEMNGSYLIYASLHWDNTDFGEVDLIDIEETLHLIDEDGQEVLWESYSDEQTGIQYDQRQTVFAVKTTPVQSKTLTLMLDALLVNLPVEASFEFDPGQDPQPGQIWEPGLEFTFGEYSLKVDKITLEGANGYSFDMSSETGIRKAAPADFDHPVVSGYEGEGDESHFFSGFYYAESLPTEPVTFSITSIWVEQSVQQLQAVWTLPETPADDTAEALPGHTALCLTPEKWQAGLNQSLSIPAGLTGRLLTYGPVDPSNLNGAWETALVNLDGSQRVSVSSEKSAVSPDGTMLAYPAADAGIMVKDLSTNETTLLQGTIAGDNTPLWSLDGKSIVFMRNSGIFDLFSVNLDGSGARQLTFGGVQEIPLAWLGDASLLYEALELDGSVVYRLDLSSGESQLFSNEGIRSVSPDGKYLAITRLVMEERWQIIISDPTGEQRWDLTDGGMSVFNPIWSPDGQWILATVLSTDGGPAMGVLINLTSCEIVPLPHLQDDILAWIP